ncbi:MAG: hypothetical protein F4Y61_06305 [Rhodothermaceae bacterium]|nr:hypothetical protein [Rhodothermaceae bacterium]
MLNLRLTLATIVLLVLAGSIQAEESEPVAEQEGVWRAEFGVHTYFLEGEASDDSSSDQPTRRGSDQGTCNGWGEAVLYELRVDDQGRPL